jgi:hypothetical protein
MRLTILAEDETAVDATVADDRVLVAPDDLTAATGWTRKPEGLCRGAVCVPVRDPLVDGPGGLLDLAAVSAALGQKMVLDVEAGAVAIAGDPMGRGEVRNLHEVTLPDLDGNPVHLSKLAGKKTVLLAWASW